MSGRLDNVLVVLVDARRQCNQGLSIVISASVFAWTVFSYLKFHITPEFPRFSADLLWLWSSLLPKTKNQLTVGLSI